MLGDIHDLDECMDIDTAELLNCCGFSIIITDGRYVQVETDKTEE